MFNRAVLSAHVLGCAVVAAASIDGQWLEPECIAELEVASAVQSELFGWTAVPVGDINNDGVIDVVVSAVFANDGASSAGKVMAVSGASGQTLWTHIETLQSSVLGYSMELAGDVNGDGIQDVLIGAPFHTATGGRVWLLSGRTGQTIHLFDPINASGDAYGASVAAGGDFDGDGVNDFAIAAIGVDSGGHTNNGRVYIYSGVDFSLITTIDGPFSEAQFGHGLSFLGDITGNGRDEIVIGHRLSQFFEGRLMVYGFDKGAAVERYTIHGVGMGYNLIGNRTHAGLDVNGDGFPDIFAGDMRANEAYVFSGLDGSLIHTFNGGGEGGDFGTGRLIPDINSDGRSDIIVGSWGNDLGASGGGRVFVYSGADGSLVRTMTYTVANGHFGIECRPIGDFNGNGAIDFLIGATGGGFQGPPTGRIFIMAGIPADQTSAVLVDFAFPFGTWLSGDLASLATSDGDELVGHSQFGFSAQEPNLIELIVDLATAQTSPSSLTVIIDTRLDNPGGLGRLRLRNWKLSQWDEIDTFPVGTQNVVREVVDIAAGEYVDQSDGAIRISLRHSVLATFAATGFRAMYDRASVLVSGD